MYVTVEVFGRIGVINPLNLQNSLEPICAGKKE